MPGNIYEAYNPFAGTQRNIDRFADLMQRRKEMGLKERGLGLEERRMGLAEQQEARLGKSAGIEDAYRQTLIERESEEIRRKQELEQDPSTAVIIMSKALREAREAGGEKLAESVFNSFKQNPKYQRHVSGYDYSDFKYTPQGAIYAKTKDEEGNVLPGQYSLVHGNEIFQLDLREKTSGGNVSVPQLAFTATNPNATEEEREHAKEALTMVNKPAMVKDTQTGEYVLVGRTGEKISTGVSGKPIIPGGEVSKTASLQTMKDIAGEVDRLFDPSYTGAIKGAVSGKLEKWTDLLPEEQIAFNTASAQLYNIMGHIRYGGAFTENEIARLEKEMPTNALDPKTFRVRLKSFTKMLDSEISARNKEFEKAGYRGIDNSSQAKPSLDDIFKGQ